jgi:hypothetical protein
MPTPIDISNRPELLDLVEEVEATKTPRASMRDNKPVALLTPIVKTKAKWEKIKATFGSWRDLDPDEVIADIHRWREEGSRPATRPFSRHRWRTPIHGTQPLSGLRTPQVTPYNTCFSLSEDLPPSHETSLQRGSAGFAGICLGYRPLRVAFRNMHSGSPTAMSLPRIPTSHCTTSY